MQSFVRQVDPVTREISFGDVADKQAIAAMMDKIKLDVVEAKILTGTDDLAKAADNDHREALESRLQVGRQLARDIGVCHDSSHGSDIMTYRPY